ncbi:MAG: aminoglycoside phosphotransferase family protein [Egibacteraceae bacterium]
MPPDASIPAAFVRTVTDAHGAAGRSWLQRLPEVLEGCARRWRLTVGPPFALSYNYVAPAERTGGARCVIKLGVPGSPDLITEATALELLGGEGTVGLLEQDLDSGALLLERAEPGGALSALVPHRDEEATAAAATVLRRLWRPAPPKVALPSVAELGRGFRWYRSAHGAHGPLPVRLVATAERVFAELAGSTDAAVVLHGDLHHDNLLSARRAPWLAIDPHGVVGDRAYDCAQLLTNPRPLPARSSDLQQVLTRRVDQLADLLDLDRDRVAGWGFAKAVLSEIWSCQDHGGPDGTPLRVARLLLHRG